MDVARESDQSFSASTIMQFISQGDDFDNLIWTLIGMYFCQEQLDWRYIRLQDKCGFVWKTDCDHNTFSWLIYFHAGITVHVLIKFQQNCIPIKNYKCCNLSF